MSRASKWCIPIFTSIRKSKKKRPGSFKSGRFLMHKLMFVSLTLEIHNSKLQIAVFSAKTI